MIDSHGRAAYQRWIINPILKWKCFDKVHPNSLTFLATLVGLLTLPFAAFHLGIIAAIALLISGFLDTLDGSLARKYDKATEKGTFLDIVSDRIVECAAILALYLYDPERALLCLLMVIAALLCITTFLTVGIFTENRSQKGFHYSAGLMERFEAIALFALMFAVPATFFWASLIFTVGTAFTAAYRTYEFTCKHFT